MRRKVLRDCVIGVLLLFVLPLAELSGAIAQESVFTVQQPDFQKSPYTGMTRQHWIQAGEYLLKGAFGYIHTLDDQMYFPKQLDKTYPNNDGQVPVAKLEGLARTLFIAAPLLKDNPELVMNGIRVADYYRNQLVGISNPKSPSFISHRKGGPSQTLLELGSLAISMKAAQAVLWDPLTKAQKDSLAATMLSYGEGPTIGSNWMFFNVFILSFLKDQALIYFIPAAFIVLFYLLKKKKYPAAIPVMALFMVVCTCVMYGFLINHMMSFYYYFKIYYNLWLFGWLLCVMAADILADEKQLAGFYAYVGFIGILALFTFTNYDMNMWEFDPGYNEASVPKHFLAIYWNNLDTSQKDYGEYTILPDLMEVMSYAAEELDDDKIPALVADDRTFYWFDGMRAQNTRKYKPYNRELMDILVKMDKNGITKIFVDKEDKIYQQYENYFSLCKAVYENERAAILTFPGESWCKILPYVNGYDEGKLELYKYVKKHLKNERVPLMAAKESCLDFIIYRQKTKQKSTDCYTWNFNPKENLDNLNQLGIKYITVLYGDSYYQENQYYLDGQETVFENESGKIIKCAGDSFSTEYK